MRISRKKQEKISEQILGYLFSVSPRAVFTSHIASEIIRDEEFTKKLLLNLEKKGFVIQIKKSPKGKRYLKRQRWKLSDKVYQTYKQYQR